MADDLLLTQEEQDERAKKWLKENGMALAVGITLGLGAVFGFNQYKANQLAMNEQASALYSSVSQRYGDSALADIDSDLELLKNDHSDSPYAAKAALIKAKQLSVADLPAAANELQWVIDNASESGVKHAAAIRLAKIRLAQGELDAATEVASKEPYDGFGSYYHEILADVAAQRNEAESARDHYQQAIDQLSVADSGYSAILTLKMNKLPESAASPE